MAAPPPTDPRVGNNNWSALGAGTWYGSTTAVGGGGDLARDQLDAARMGVARIPSAEYPDGYLGTINPRRGDRLLASVQANNRSYVRGVHKGEKIDPGDYIWPASLQPDRGIINERRGLKTAPLLDMAPHPHLVNDGKADPPQTVPLVVDRKRRAQMGRLVPVWT